MAATERVELAEDALAEAKKAHGEESAEFMRAGLTLGEAHCDAGNIQQARIALECAYGALKEAALWKPSVEYLKALLDIYRDDVVLGEHVEKFFQEHDADNSGSLHVDEIYILCNELCCGLVGDMTMPTNRKIMRFVQKADRTLAGCLEKVAWQRAFKAALKSVILHVYDSRLEDGLEASLRISKTYFCDAALLFDNLTFIYSILDNRDRHGMMLERAFRIREAIGVGSPSALAIEQLSGFFGRPGCGDADVGKQLVLLERAERLTDNPKLLRIASAIKTGRFDICCLQPGLQKDNQSLPIDAISRFFVLLFRSSSTEHVGGRLMLKTPETMFSILEQLSAVIADSGQSDKQKLEKVIVAASTSHGEQSIQVAVWKYLLAEILGVWGDFKAKRDTLLEVLKIQQQEFGFDSLFVTWTLKGLAHAEGQLGNLDAKREHLKRAFEIQEEELGQSHPQTEVTLHFLQDVEETQRKLKDPDGSKELIGLFGRQVPPDQKVYRYLPKDERSDIVSYSKLKSEDVEPQKHFLMKAYGGGACEFHPEAGIRVPFYFNTS